MNPWDIFLLVLGWFSLAMLGVVVLIFALAAVVGISRGVRNWFPSKNSDALPEPSVRQDDYMAEATVAGFSLYKNDPVHRKESIESFRAGARWGWLFFSGAS